MSKKNVKIRLRKGQPKSIEIIAANKSIKASGQTAVSVPETDVQFWLNTGRFELVPAKPKAKTKTKAKGAAGPDTDPPANNEEQDRGGNE